MGDGAKVRLEIHYTRETRTERLQGKKHEEEGKALLGGEKNIGREALYGSEGG